LCSPVLLSILLLLPSPLSSLSAAVLDREGDKGSKGEMQMRNKEKQGKRSCWFLMEGGNNWEENKAAFRGKENTREKKKKSKGGRKGN